MIISIKRKDEKYCNFLFRLGEFKKIIISAHTSYYMKIYSSEKENYDFVTACEKLEKDIKNYVYVDDIDSITILEFKQISKECKVLSEELRSKGAKSLIAQIHFKANNRNPSSKIIRWPIRIYNENGFLVKRIPVLVLPRVRGLLFFVLHCFGIVLLTDAYSDFSRYLLNEEIIPSSWNMYFNFLLLKSVVVATVILIAICIYDLIRVLFEWSSFH
ncbi:hypothetical protein [Candidatus Uabimicrobium sp. HlEnr_7]|uniref:hypothetical protein n=1 Tax=Candidatus Uabimicrobium helgolandensis TaxID=3095367 RepID=UPI00355690E8